MMIDRKEVMDRVYNFMQNEENATLGDDIEYLVSKLEESDDLEEKQEILKAIVEELNSLNA